MESLKPPFSFTTSCKTSNLDFSPIGSSILPDVSTIRTTSIFGLLNVESYFPVTSKVSVYESSPLYLIYLRCAGAVFSSDDNTSADGLAVSASSSASCGVSVFVVIAISEIVVASVFIVVSDVVTSSISASVLSVSDMVLSSVKLLSVFVVISSVMSAASSIVFSSTLNSDCSAALDTLVQIPKIIISTSAYARIFFNIKCRFPSPRIFLPPSSQFNWI